MLVIRLQTTTFQLQFTVELLWNAQCTKHIGNFWERFMEKDNSLYQSCRKQEKYSEMLKVKCCTFFQYKFLECLSEGYNFTTKYFLWTTGLQLVRDIFQEPREISLAGKTAEAECIYSFEIFFYPCLKCLYKENVRPSGNVADVPLTFYNFVCFKKRRVCHYK